MSNIECFVLIFPYRESFMLATGQQLGANMDPEHGLTGV